MIQFKSNNDFLLSALTDLFEQKNLIEKNLLNFPHKIIHIDDSTDKLILTFDDYKKFFSKPSPFSSIFNDLRKEIMKISYQINSLCYFPYLREIINGKVRIHLSDIQNKILLLLVANKNGVNKEGLYKFIWPNDKDISINKLDTHLTNLKNLISDELKFDVNFKSLDKNLKLIIN